MKKKSLKTETENEVIKFPLHSIVQSIYPNKLAWNDFIMFVHSQCRAALTLFSLLLSFFSPYCKQKKWEQKCIFICDAIQFSIEKKSWFQYYVYVALHYITLQCIELNNNSYEFHDATENNWKSENAHVLLQISFLLTPLLCMRWEVIYTIFLYEFCCIMSAIFIRTFGVT